MSYGWLTLWQVGNILGTETLKQFDLQFYNITPSRSIMLVSYFTCQIDALIRTTGGVGVINSVKDERLGASYQQLL
jgi:hypothetical protein